MRVASYRAGEETSWGVVIGDHISDARQLNSAPHTVRELLDSSDQRRWLDTLADPAARTFALADVQLQAPLEPRQDLIALGLNYKTHVAETTGCRLSVRWITKTRVGLPNNAMAATAPHPMPSKYSVQKIFALMGSRESRMPSISMLLSF